RHKQAPALCKGSSPRLDSTEQCPQKSARAGPEDLRNPADHVSRAQRSRRLITEGSHDENLVRLHVWILERTGHDRCKLCRPWRENEAQAHRNDQCDCSCTVLESQRQELNSRHQADEYHHHRKPPQSDSSDGTEVARRSPKERRRKANDACDARFHGFISHRLERDVAAVTVANDKVSSLGPACLYVSQVRDQTLDGLVARSDRIPARPQELLEPDRLVHRRADRAAQRRRLRC